MTKKIWQPIVNCGFNAGDLPSCFEASFEGFETEADCEKWIENNQVNFTMNELGGGVFPQEFEVENPTILDSDGEVVWMPSDEENTPKQNVVYVVQSLRNLSCCDSETCFNVVGVADNKERAKEMLKEEVQNWFDCLNERFYDEDDAEWSAFDHELSVENKQDFPDNEWYRQDESTLDIFCEVNILEMKVNA